MARPRCPLFVALFGIALLAACEPLVLPHIQPDGPGVCAESQVLWSGECLLDTDEDGIPDRADNCPTQKNPQQHEICDQAASLDSDGDGHVDTADNCPNHPNPDQLDSDKNGMGNACQASLDSDQDGVVDALDNCPTVPNPLQTDHDGDGEGDFCTTQDGTLCYPIIIPTTAAGTSYSDQRDTSQAPSDEFDTYPPSPVNESGPEFIYTFAAHHRSALRVWIDLPEPTGVDIDVHLLAGLTPLELLARDHHAFETTVEGGHLLFGFGHLCLRQRR